jgi:hypothetical protein
MKSPVIETVMGIDIWKEGDGYEIYDGMAPLGFFDTLEEARRGARRYARTTTL